MSDYGSGFKNWPAELEKRAKEIRRRERFYAALLLASFLFFLAAATYAFLTWIGAI